MNKTDGFGMKVEPVSRSPVKIVAHDGGVEPIGVGRMNAKLMRASGFRIKSYASQSVRIGLQ